MVQESSADESLEPALRSTKGTAVWVPSRFAALLNVLIGFLLLIVAPLAMSIAKSHFNGPVLAVNTVFAVIIIVFGIFDYRAQLSKNRNLWKKLPTVMIVLGFILFFFYSEFYATPWIKTYHLYLVPIDSYGSIFYMSYYVARDYLSTMSHTGGILIILLALYEIAYVKYVAGKENKTSLNKQ